MKKNIMFISSTGGHLTELLELDKIIKNSNYSLITENTDEDIALKYEGKKVYDYTVTIIAKTSISY